MNTNGIFEDIEELLAFSNVIVVLWFYFLKLYIIYRSIMKESPLK